jgi:hypothetical protein
VESKKSNNRYQGQVTSMIHACLFPSSLASLKARYLKKLNCSSKLGMPGDTMYQEKRVKQPMKKILCEFVCEKRGEKMTFPRIL